MCGCQEQNREGDLGGSLGFGWTGRPKADNILLVRWGVTPSILEVNEFPMWRFSPSISLKVKNILLSMSAYLVAPMSTYHYS